MRVLVVHNRYRSEMPSGENRVVDDETEMLRAAGVEVVSYIRSSDEISEMSLLARATLPISPIYNFEASRELRGLIRSTKPDVMHLHNPFPLISPWAVRVAKAEGIPVVQTVHNFRHVCMNGLFFRDGQICRECEGKSIGWPGVRYGCYRGSKPQSAVMAATLAAHRGTWKLVDRFLPVSQFIADVLIANGVPAERITVKPNAIRDPGPPLPFGPPAVLFLGRLSEEKGIDMLLEAWAMADLPAPWTLRIAGDGPLRGRVSSVAAGSNSITYLGPLPPDGVPEFFASGWVLAVPSIWYEGLPRVIAEAFAHGRTVLVSDLGGLAPLVRTGAGEAVQPRTDAWAAHLRALASRPRSQGTAPRDYFRTELEAGVVLANLREIYDAVSRD